MLHTCEGERRKVLSGTSQAAATSFELSHLEQMEHSHKWGISAHTNKWVANWSTKWTVLDMRALMCYSRKQLFQREFK